jgi:hypothetical protein
MVTTNESKRKKKARDGNGRGVVGRQAYTYKAVYIYSRGLATHLYRSSMDRIDQIYLELVSIISAVRMVSEGLAEGGRFIVAC